MVWYFVNGGPLTTESHRWVETEDGRQGVVSIRHVNGRPQPYGGVWEREDGEIDSQTGEELPNACLDACPTLRYY